MSPKPRIGRSPAATAFTQIRDMKALFDVCTVAATSLGGSLAEVSWGNRVRER